MKKFNLSLLIHLFIALILFHRASAQALHTPMDSVRTCLRQVFKTDQQYRIPLDSILRKQGANSPQIDSLYDLIGVQDSINLAIVTHILDTYGWLSPDSIGETGDMVLWLVIQHADLDVQEKYLPMMRDAVKKGNAKASDLAYLEDRVALGEGKKQIYGTQFQLDSKTNKYTIAPIEDEMNVDKRRAAVGLESLEDYARSNGIVYTPPAQRATPTPPTSPTKTSPPAPSH